MDWSKAKSIFIFAFLLLNILLGYQIYLKQTEYINNMQWTSNNIDELKNLLLQQKIKLNFDLPKEVPAMHFLQVKNVIYSDYTEITKKTEDYSERSSLEAILKESVYSFDQYEYSESESNGIDHFVYYQVKNKFPFFGATLEIFIKDEQSIFYSQNYFEVMNQGLDRQVISSQSALRTVLDQQLIPKGAEITKIILGYHGQPNQSTIQVLTPVWKITYRTIDANQEIYVNAMTGGLENLTHY